MDSKRGIILAGCALIWAAGVSVANAKTSSNAHSFSIGALTAASVRDASDALPNDGKIFGVDQGPDAVAQVLKSKGAPTDKIALSINVLMVRDRTRVMLFDTGVPPMAAKLMQRLKALGIAPADVTDVYITHSHGDHVGGLSTGGALSFPKADIHMSGTEWAFMKTDAQSAALVKLIEAKVRTFQPGDVLSPTVRSVDLSGHTPGHVGYLIHSGKDSLMDIGDIAHSSIVSLAKPDWPMGFDTDRVKGAATRRSQLAVVAQNHQPIFAPHFPYPGLGQIEAAADGFTWRAMAR